MPAPSSPPPEVPDDCRAYRLIRPDWVKIVDGEERPTSQAFQNARDGAMSVFFEDEMRAAGVTVSDLLETYPAYNRVVELSVGEMRKLGQLVERDPNDEFPGHGAVRHPGSMNRPGSAKTKLSNAAVWVKE